MGVKATSAVSDYGLAANGRDVDTTCKLTDIGSMPMDWTCVPISEVAANRPNAIVGGPFGSDLVSKDYVSAGVPVVRGQNLAARYVSGDFVFVSKSKAKKLEANLARPGDIIFTQRGTLGQVSIVPADSFAEYVVSQSQMKLSLNTDVASEAFILQYFISSSGQKQILESAIQTGVPHTNLGILRSYRVPLPPTRGEQEAIGEALSDADALIESLEQLLIKKRRIKQGAMQELLTGKTRLPGFEGEWSIRPLGEIGECVAGLTYAPRDVRSDGLLVLRASNVFEGTLRFEDNVYVQMDVPRRVFVEEGDILICVRNGSRDLIGKCAKIDGRAHGMVFGTFMAVFRTQYHDFVYHQFQSEGIKRQIGEHLGATINQITNRSLRSFRIPFPHDAAERASVAKLLSDMDEELAVFEAKLLTACQIKQGMMQELLTGRIRIV